MIEEIDHLRLFPVHFVYLGADGTEDLSTVFTVHCVAVPRVGETVVPQAGSGPKTVVNVYHKVMASAEGPLAFITVVLRDRPSS